MSDAPVSPAFLRALGLTGHEDRARLEHKGPSFDGWAEAAILVRCGPGGRTLEATVRLTNPTEGEFRRLCEACRIELPAFTPPAPQLPRPDAGPG